MAPLYVVEQGAKIQKEAHRILITREGEEITSVPIIKVDQVILFGNISITTPAIAWFLDQNIEVVFCDQHGRYRGRLVGQTGGQSQLRRLQYRRADSPLFAANTAREIVKAKLQNSRTLLMRYQRRDETLLLTPLIDQLAALMNRADRCQTANSLLGVEGIGAATYFDGFRQLFKRDDLKFEKRVRRPPTDPINVLLSFGYTLLAHNMQAAVETVGLDPFIGFLHVDDYNRPSLALDLIEEFRSIIVDSVVLRCLNSDLITPANFTAQNDPDRPILLDDPGRNRFIQEFEARLALTFSHPAREEKVTYRRCFELQARDIARAIQSDGLYHPFVVR